MRAFVIATCVAAAATFAMSPTTPPPLELASLGPANTVPAWIVAGRVPDGLSLVIVHNASGRTAFGGHYVVSFDDTKVAKLARCQYTAVLLAPGEHRGWVGSFRHQPFTTARGRVTHWAVAYAPGKSWIAPFGGQSFAYGVIPDSLGRLMMREHQWVEPLVPLPEPLLTDSTAAAI